MQFLIISDLHANWQALQAVLADAEGQYQSVVCCGDIVGYNPDPGPVLDWTRQHCSLLVRGNHDKVIAGIDDLEWFNDVAKTAARWSMDVLSTEQLSYLRELPKGPRAVSNYEIWHGSVADEDEYITSAEEARRRFMNMATPLGFFGHTHLQGGFFVKHGRVGTVRQVAPKERERCLELEPDVMYMINPGSVGQPRDRDPRAAYAIYDGDQKVVTFRRVAYPIAETVEAIKKVGLPDSLGLRLQVGR